MLSRSLHQVVWLGQKKESYAISALQTAANNQTTDQNRSERSTELHYTAGGQDQLKLTRLAGRIKFRCLAYLRPLAAAKCLIACHFPLYAVPKPGGQSPDCRLMMLVLTLFKTNGFQHWAITARSWGATHSEQCCRGECS